MLIELRKTKSWFIFSNDIFTLAYRNGICACFTQNIVIYTYISKQTITSSVFLLERATSQKTATSIACKFLTRKQRLSQFLKFHLKYDAELFFKYCLFVVYSLLMNDSGQVFVRYGNKPYEPVFFLQKRTCALLLAVTLIATSQSLCQWLIHPPSARR